MPKLDRSIKGSGYAHQMRSRATSETDHGNIAGPWSDLPVSFVGVLVTGHPVEESDPLVGRTGAQQSIDQPLR